MHTVQNVKSTLTNYNVCQGFRLQLGKKIDGYFGVNLEVSYILATNCVTNVHYLAKYQTLIRIIAYLIQSCFDTFGLRKMKSATNLHNCNE